MISRLVLPLVLVSTVAAADPRAEVQIDALGLLDQRVELSATGLITPNLGATLTLADQLDGTSRQVALSLPVFAQSAFRGFFIEPGMLAGGRWSSNCLSCAPDINKTISAEVLFGWSWLFDSGLTLAMAIGAQVEVACYDNDCGIDPAISPAGYFKLGWAF
ncbi:MAG TPA: hypothetical protein VGL61_20625 [Kofleriaceae bacterium]|jgi:hypothetical protein